MKPPRRGLHMNKRAVMKKETEERVRALPAGIGTTWRGRGVDCSEDRPLLPERDGPGRPSVGPGLGAALLMVRKSFERAKQDAVTERIVPFTSLSQLPAYIKEQSGGLPGRMGLEMDVLPVKFYLAYQRQFPKTEMTDISELIRQVRMIKSPMRSNCMVRAAKMADRMLGKIPEFLTEAKRDIDLTLMVEAFYRSQGHPGIVPTRGFNRDPSTVKSCRASGRQHPSNSAGPHGGEGLGPFFSRGASLAQDLEAFAHHGGLRGQRGRLHFGPDPHFFDRSAQAEAAPGTRRDAEGPGGHRARGKTRRPGG